MARKTLAQRRERDEARKILEDNTFDLTIGGRIKERAKGTANTSTDWYANELYNELHEHGEVRFPEIGELCYFTYSAAYPEKYPWYDRRPLAFIMEYEEDKLLAANLHYLNPSYRDGVARGLINKVSARLPEKTLHRYFFSNIGDIFIVPPDADEWASVAELVTEKFVNKYGREVELQKVWDTP